MEALYSKLYDKYTKLKAQKAAEIEHFNFDQEEKFTTYVSAADELIGHLTSEKDRLYTQVIDLRQELITIRSAKDEEQEKYEKMLLQEKQKNKELSEEIEGLHRKELLSTTNEDMFGSKQVSGSPLSSGRANNSTKRKRHRNSIHEKEVEVALVIDGQHNHTSPGESETAVDKENMFSSAFYNANRSKCCHQRLGDSVNASAHTTCMFQELVEYLLDLKFAVATQSDQNMQITAVHESSGYSFNLGWVKNGSGEEELMYDVSSLGTFERVAPEWMRDAIIFSKSMCRIFFKRLSTIVHLQD